MTIYFESNMYIGKIEVGNIFPHYVAMATTYNKYSGERDVLNSYHRYLSNAKNKQEEMLSVATKNDYASVISPDEYDILLLKIKRKFK
jgi:hypothetical protein